MSQQNNDHNTEANLKFLGLLTNEDVDQIEKNMHKQGVNRRIALLFLTMSLEDMVSKYGKSEEDMEVLVETAECLQGYLDSLQSCKEIAETAQARVLMVLHGKLNLRGE